VTDQLLRALNAFPNDVESFVAVSRPFKVKFESTFIDCLHGLSLLGLSGQILNFIGEEILFSISCFTQMKPSYNGTHCVKYGIVCPYKLNDITQAGFEEVFPRIYRTCTADTEDCYFTLCGDLLLWAQSVETVNALISNLDKNNQSTFLDRWPFFEGDLVAATVFGGSCSSLPAFHKYFAFAFQEKNDQLEITLPLIPTNALDFVIRNAWLLMLGKPDLSQIDLLPKNGIGYAAKLLFNMICNLVSIRLGLKTVKLSLSTVLSYESQSGLVMLIMGGIGLLGGGF
jgi:hypothetical protein